jgi:hypothetical protein
MDGKSVINRPICTEKNQMINPIQVNNTSNARPIETPSLALILRKNRTRGSKRILKKKAMISGVRTPLPTTMIIPKTNSPISSMDLLTVMGISVIQMVDGFGKKRLALASGSIDM